MKKIGVNMAYLLHKLNDTYYLENLGTHEIERVTLANDEATWNMITRSGNDEQPKHTETLASQNGYPTNEMNAGIKPIDGKDSKFEFVFLTYNPSKKFQWSMHRKGCADIDKELKGKGTDSGFPASDPEIYNGADYKEAAEKFLSSINHNLIEEGGHGWPITSIRINPCCMNGGKK